MTDEELLIYKLQHFIQHAMTDACKCKSNDHSFYCLEHAMMNIDSYYRAQKNSKFEDVIIDLATI